MHYQACQTGMMYPYAALSLGIKPTSVAVLVGLDAVVVVVYDAQDECSNKIQGFLYTF